VPYLGTAKLREKADYDNFKINKILMYSEAKCGYFLVKDLKISSIYAIACLRILPHFPPFKKIVWM
jgi:hypothetical protein